jgi:hypothetical protein
MASLQDLKEEISTGDDRIVDELENNEDLLKDIKELLGAQLNLSKNIAERERLAFENQEFESAESLAESGRNISSGSDQAPSDVLSNMTKSFLSGIGPLSMSRIGGGIAKLLRGGLLTALAVNYGEQIGKFLQENIQDIMTDVGFQEEVSKAFGDNIAKYTPSVAIGAAIGSIFGARGVIIGSLLGAASEYYQIPEFYDQLKNAVSDEEKERIKNEFIDQFTDNPGETAAAAAMIGAMLFGVKGAVVMGLSAFLITALGLERLTTSEGRADLANDLKNQLLFDITGGKKGEEADLSLFGTSTNIVRKFATHAADRVTNPRLAERAVGAYQTRRGRQQASQRAAQEAAQESAQAAAARTSQAVTSSIIDLSQANPQILDATGRPIITETVQETGEAVLREGIETTAKEIGQKGIMAIAKKAPFGVGFLLSLPFAAGDLIAGDYTGAGLEFAAGLTSMVPGFGTVASYGITGADVARDVAMAHGMVEDPRNNDNDSVAVGAYQTRRGRQQASQEADDTYDSVPEMNRGTLGTYGKLFQDFGAGTPVVLHGKEAVITPEQYTTLIKPDVSQNEISNISRSVASSSSIVAVQPVTNNFNSVNNSTNVSGGGGGAPAQLPAGAPKDYDRSLTA